MDWLQDYVRELLALLVDPRKRVSVTYLASAALIALVWGTFTSPSFKKGIHRGFSQLFSRKIWLSRSSVGDYQLFLVNHAVMMTLMPWLLSRLALTTAIFFWLHEVFESRPALGGHTHPWLVMSAFTATLFLLDDATRYLVHRLLHRVPGARPEVRRGVAGRRRGQWRSHGAQYTTVSPRPQRSIRPGQHFCAQQDRPRRHNRAQNRRRRLAQKSVATPPSAMRRSVKSSSSARASSASGGGS